MDLGLAGRSCVVTGSTGGVGLATARLLVEEGARVVTCGRRAPASARSSTCRPTSPCRATERVIAEAATVDVLVNNVGTARPRYSVTKAAVLSLSRLVADLYAADGIRCNAVTPGPTATEAWLGEGGLADQQGGDREEVLRTVAAGRPIGRLSAPERSPRSSSSSARPAPHT